MEKAEKQYTDKIEQQQASGYENESLDSVLPQWIINIKNYFKRDSGINRSSACK